MKILRSEFAHSYKTYSFGYCQYAIREEGDQLCDIYDSGYLPYSGTRNITDTLYMARSARVKVSAFKLNSENRRVAKQCDGTLSRKDTPFEEFDATNEPFLSFCLAYFKKHGGDTVMPKERLLTILNAKFITHIVTYYSEKKPVAYVFEIRDATMTHFWFSFYDLAYIRQSLGMWLMIDALRNAQNAGKKYFYLGTIYGEKALYKTNFDALEYWNGNIWVRDKKYLRERSRSDNERTFDVLDEWKHEGMHFF